MARVNTGARNGRVLMREDLVLDRLSLENYISVREEQAQLRRIMAELEAEEEALIQDTAYGTGKAMGTPRASSPDSGAKLARMADEIDRMHREREALKIGYASVLAELARRQAEVEATVGLLPSYERRLIRALYMEGMTLEEAAEVFHFSKRQIQRQRDRILDTLERM